MDFPAHITAMVSTIRREHEDRPSRVSQCLWWQGVPADAEARWRRRMKLLSSDAW